MKTTNFSSMLIAFFLALGVAGLVYTMQKQPAAKDVQKDDENTKILVAKLGLKPGERLNINKFRWVEWPKSSLQDDYYAEEEKEEVS